MLSQDIGSLRQKFAEHRHGGITLGSEQVELLVKNLRTCEELARNMEESLADGRARLAVLEHGSNVTLFPKVARSRPRGVHLPQPPSGGDAA